MTGLRADVRLRPLDRGHLDRTLAWTNDPALARLTNRARRIESDEHERWFAGLGARRDTICFAIECADRHVGNVWLADIDRRHRRAEVRVIIGAADALGQGIGSSALRQIADYAFDTLGLHRVFAYVLAFNERARRAFEAAGFQVEGVLRDDRWSDDRFVDVYVLGFIQPAR